MPTKHALRTLMRERLRAMSETTRSSASAQIAAHILHHRVAWPPNTTIALFGGLKNEPDLLPHLLPVLSAQGACLSFFQIEAGELQARQVRALDDLQRGQMNVWEPKPQCAAIPIAALDLILVPGLAFTRDGARLGRGGGYYDRLLAHPQCRAKRIAIAYDLQLVDRIPLEPHDQHVHQIITESGLIQSSVSH